MEIDFGGGQCGRLPMPTRGRRTDALAASDRVGVLVIDDSAEVRWVICDIVSATAGMVVVGQACSGAAGVDAADRLKPRLVIMDVHMPGLDGVEATRHLIRGHPEAVVLLVSVDDVDPDVVRSCGATLFLRKQCLSPAALRRVWQTLQP